MQMVIWITTMRPSVTMIEENFSHISSRIITSGVSLSVHDNFLVEILENNHLLDQKSKVSGVL